MNPLSTSLSPKPESRAIAFKAEATELAISRRSLLLRVTRMAKSSGCKETLRVVRAIIVQRWEYHQKVGKAFTFHIFTSHDFDSNSIFYKIVHYLHPREIAVRSIFLDPVTYCLSVDLPLKRTMASLTDTMYTVENLDLRISTAVFQDLATINRQRLTVNDDYACAV